MAAKNRYNHIDCLGAALDDEEYFVLLARDPAFPALVAIWASLRVGNVAAAAENFTLLMAPELVAHYRMHPDIAKSEEAISTANRGMEWRAANLAAGPDGKPSWKSSLVRPKMIDVTPAADQELIRKIACGLRQITESIASDTLAANRTVQEWQDRVNGFAAELEAALPEEKEGQA